MKVCPTCGSESSGELCLKCAGRELKDTLFKTESTDAPPPHAPAPPGWHLQKLMASGGMGQLWLATSEQGDRRAVVKVPLKQHPQVDELAARFETEAELLATLSHPNILSVVDIGTCKDGRLFIATEFVDGCDLQRLLRAGPVPAERAIDIISKVCDALEHAHSKGVVHRDLKPSNILVASDGTVKVADFGLAKDISPASTEGATSAGDGLGTPYYLAPESMRNAARADERSDVYALGILLYELLTGSVPLGAYTPLSRIAGFSRNWDTFVNNALSDRPEQRMASVTAFKDGLLHLWKRERKRDSRKRMIRRIALAAAILPGAALLLFHKEKPPVYPSPETATGNSPWENSIGMRFLPVGTLNILMAETETTLSQFEEFHIYEKGTVPEWRLDAPGVSSDPGMVVMTADGPVSDGNATPRNPGYETTPEHPVTGVAYIDTWAFCTWLTMKERAEKRIGENQRYRLPTIAEWLTASVGETPDLGNYRGLPHPHAAPVSAMRANPNGFIAMGGNAAEWVIKARQSDSPATAESVFIGFSWNTPRPTRPPRAISIKVPGARRNDVGFRVVLDLEKNSPAE